jgi:hypothetical protein
MNTKEYKIFVVILIIIAIIVVGYGFTKHPNTVTSPSVTAVPTGSTVSTLSIVSIHETASSSPQVNVQYPQFSSLPPSANEDIASSTKSRLADFRDTVAENMAARFATGGSHDEISSSSYSFNASWQPAQVSDRYVSFIIRYDSYSGGANENQEIQTFNYDVASGTPLTLEDLFPNISKLLQKISAIAREQLRSSLSSAAPGYTPDQMLSEGTAPLDENFSNFTFTDNAITFYFPKYAVAPGAFGEQRVVISRSSIK